jgi:hypothetical protein
MSQFQILLWHKASMSYDEIVGFDVFCATKKVFDLKSLFLYPTPCVLQCYTQVPGFFDPDAVDSATAIGIFLPP